MNAGQPVVRVLDPGWLSEQTGQPVRVAWLRTKLRASLIVGLDDTADHLTGWLCILQPIGHNKVAQTRWEIDELGLKTTEHELGELLAQTGPLPTDPRLLKRITAATAPGKLRHWEASQMLRHDPLRRVVAHSGMHVVRVTTSRDRRVAFDRLIAGVIETPPRLDDGTLDGVSVHTSTGAQDLTGLLAGSPPSRPFDESRLSRAVSNSGGSWLSRAVSDSDGSQLSRAASEASGSCRNYPVADHDPTQSVPNPIRAAGAMLTRFHAARVLNDLAHSLTLRAPDPIAQGLTHVALLDELTPGLAERTRRVVTRFPGAASMIPVLSHGDLSPDQVLATHTGSRVWFVDFDRACLTPHAVDLGSFIAILGDDALLDGHRDGGGQLPLGDQLRQVVAALLILQAADPLRRVFCAWEQGTSANLDRIVEVLK